MVFSTGKNVALDEVLLNREQRANFISSTINANIDNVVLWVGCNIPGSIKNNEVIAQFFAKTVERLQALFVEKQVTICHVHQWDKTTGPEAFFILNAHPLKVKELAIDFEEQASGRLLDLDVTYYDKKQDVQKTMKRTALGHAPRRCLLCENDAKVCGSRRLHPVESLQAAVAAILIENNN